jgi:RNA polymerase sigma factor (sigma-70 family)
MNQYNDYELLYLISENDDTALEIMYQKYIPLIKARIAAFRIKKYNYEDFFQEGLFTLCRAIQTYRPDYRKTFNKYFDLILQRHFIHLLRRDSMHFYQVELVENADLLLESAPVREERADLKSIIEACHFSPFERKVLDLRLKHYKTKEIVIALDCRIKQVYDATDRIKRKMKGVKNSLDKDGYLC